MTVNIISPPKFLIDPVAFFLALVLAPLIVGVLFSPIFLISIFAIVFGGLQYLLVGGPILYFALFQNKPHAGAFAGIAFLIHLAVVVGMSFIAEDADMVLFYLFFGSIFSVLWGAAFAMLYRSLCREVYSQPIH